MLNILREPDDIRIVCEEDNADCTVETAAKNGHTILWAMPIRSCFRAKNKAIKE